MPKFEIVIDPSARKINAEDTCRFVFGTGIAETAERLAKNRDGLWDRVFGPKQEVRDNE